MRGDKSHHLEWPVFWPGTEMRFHITLKYLGDVSVLHWEVFRLAGEALEKDLWAGPLAWVPAVFEFEGTKSYVLELTNVPRWAFEAHERLGKLRKDDFPKWRPHITVPKGVHDLVLATGATPMSSGISIGPLEYHTPWLVMRPRE